MAGTSACSDSSANRTEVVKASYITAADRIPGRYIVVLADSTLSAASTTELSSQLAGRYGASVHHAYRHALRGFSATMTQEDALELATDPSVAWVEEDGLMRTIETQSPATWGLDRIDQRSPPLDDSYTYNANGAGVNAYVIDTGIRISHEEFGGRASHGWDSVDRDADASDCNGHGTHVAGTVGGASYGVAKAVNLIGVRVLDCDGSGSTSGVIAGIDWVTDNHVAPAVANMSLGGGASSSLDQAVRNSIQAGVAYALAAGNENANACGSSPARTAEAITVGSSTQDDTRSSFSNFGTCVDIFAPGSSITSAWYQSDNQIRTISGTSMASPHVAGAAALYLGENPDATPQEVRDALVDNGSQGRLSGVGSGSPNVLLYEAFIGGGGDLTPPQVALTTPADGARVSGTIVVQADVTDNVGVTWVELRIDGQLIQTKSPPATFDWDAAGFPSGNRQIEVFAFDAANNSGSDRVTVVVDSSDGGGGQNAVFNPALGAPVCASVAGSCDTATLVQGRGTRGPEQDAPNTLGSTCPDGNAGAYQDDESVERIAIRTVDGQPFAPGRTVNVDLHVWVWSNPANDRVDVFHAADANNPVWTFVATLAPSASNAQIVSTQLVLPEGPLQAIRAQARYNSTPEPCSAGNYNDRDDLVFAVGDGQPGDVEPPVVTILSPARGETVRGEVNVIYEATDNLGVETVELYVDGMRIDGGTAGTSLIWDSTAAADGGYTLEVRVTDAATNVGVAAIAVVVDNGLVRDGAAVFSPTFQAPTCDGVSLRSCTTGTLVAGRGLMSQGAELNTPNTLADSCFDGNSGAYRDDESVEAVTVRTVDGVAIARGAEVQVDVDVWAWASGGSDSVDIFYAADADNPDWVHIGTQVPPGGGAQTISATYVLPDGGASRQAVRAVIRYLSAVGPCVTGSYTDRDDLVFRVN